MKPLELGRAASEVVEAPSQQCSYLAGTRLHIERTMLPQLPAALLKRIASAVKILNQKAGYFALEIERKRDTFATPLGGYSPFSFGSTHCFTLSSLNLGVACKR